MRTTTAATDAEVTPDAITADVRHWPAPADDAAVAPQGWRVLAKQGSVSLLAAATDGSGIWFNGRLNTWSTTPDFVVFFASAFDAIARGSAEWTAELPHALGDGWRSDRKMPSGVAAGAYPAIYVDRTRRVAINAPPLSSRATVAESTLPMRFNSTSLATQSLTPWFIVIAALMSAAAAILFETPAETSLRRRG